jgi:hypothetical protein
MMPRERCPDSSMVVSGAVFRLQLAERQAEPGTPARRLRADPPMFLLARG